MTVVETTRPTVNTSATRKTEREAKRDPQRGCPPWCETHAECPEGQVSHCRFIEKITVSKVLDSIEIAVVQHEYAADESTDPTIYVGVLSGRGYQVNRLAIKEAELLSRICDRALQTQGWREFASLIDSAVPGARYLNIDKDNHGWMGKLPIALRHAATAVTGYRRTPCPRWCTDQHSLHLDTLHTADGRSVPLSRYPYWDRGDYAPSTLLVGLQQDYDDPVPHIILDTHDDQVEEEMTISEAEDLAHHLLYLVASARFRTTSSTHL